MSSDNHPTSHEAGWLKRRLTRRGLIRGGAVVALGAATLSIIGCGEEETTPAPPTAAPATQTATSAPGTPAATPSVTSTPSATATTTLTPAGNITEGGTLVFGIATEPDNLDPHVTPFAVSHTVMMNIYDTLVWRDLDGSFKAGLAEAWEQPDPTTYVFRLREGVKFHDGTPFNAEAVKFSLDRIANPDTASGFAVTLLGPYDKSEVVSDTEITVTFKTPYPPFLDAASQAFLGIVSPAAVAKHGAEFGQNPVGTGPFKFDSWTKQSLIKVVRNDEYDWPGGVFSHTGPAHFESIEFRLMAEPATRAGTVKSGESQLIEFVPEQDVASLESEGITTLRAVNPGMPITLIMDTSLAPTDEVEVRQAVNHAINRDEIKDLAFFGQSDPAYGPLSSASFGYDPAVETMYPFDPEKAKSLLEGAGWVEGDDGVREKDGKKLQFAYVVSSWPPDVSASELVQAQLKEVGIDAQIQNVDDATWLDMVTNAQANLFTSAWVSSDPNVLTDNFGPETIYTKFKDQQLFDLLAQGAVETDTEKRLGIYKQIQQIIMEQALIAPMSNWTSIFAMNPKISGVRTDFRGAYPWLYDAGFVG